MKSAYLLLVLLVVVGCKSYGPRFDARHPDKSQILPTMSFTELYGTNAIAPQWLQAPSESFRLGPGDAIEIEVLGDVISSTTASIGPDGKIYYSLLPGTFVWGLTVNETKHLLEDRLAQNLRVRPELTVSVKTVASQKVWVLGTVEKPGVYTMPAPTTLLELISMSGGVRAANGDIGDLGRSFVMREGNLLNIDFYRLVRQGDLSQNIYLQAGDYVFLGSAFAKDVYVLGAVAGPNAMPHSEDLSLLAAVARSGGPLPYAHLSSVVLIRGSLRSPRLATINYHEIRKGQLPDVRLEPGDIVYVPFSPFRKVEQLADQVLSQFVRTIAINEGRNAVFKSAQPIGVSIPFGP